MTAADFLRFVIIVSLGVLAFIAFRGRHTHRPHVAR